MGGAGPYITFDSSATHLAEWSERTGLRRENHEIYRFWNIATSWMKECEEGLLRLDGYFNEIDHSKVSNIVYAIFQQRFTCILNSISIGRIHRICQRLSAPWNRSST